MSLCSEDTAASRPSVAQSREQNHSCSVALALCIPILRLHWYWPQEDTAGSLQEGGI